MRRLTLFEFIKEAKRVHGDRYDYSEIKHVYASEKVKIICKIHGEFEQRPGDHLKRGQGCSACAGAKKSLKAQQIYSKEFIKKAQQIHGDKYNYDKVKYINSYTKVIITCPVHEDFEQTPNSHLGNHGCPVCSGTKKLSTAVFIEKARKIHGDKYNYDKVKYINSRTKVIITCPLPLHGDFEQKPNNHLNNQGCPKCGQTIISSKLSSKLSYTTEEFIEKAKQIHKDKYNYDKVKYIGVLKKVIITCPKHGDFEQTPNGHLHGRGCSKCGRAIASSTVVEFIKKAIKIHSSKYNYDKVKYINNHTKVVITCPVHEDFEQSPDSHLRNRGCPVCGGTGKLSTEQFIEKAKQIHGDKYNYAKVKYINSKTKVVITCPFHGDFEQKPNHHLSKQGCQKCIIPKGESEVERILKDKEIEYECQKEFEDCCDKKRLPFDFAINVNNKIGLIEYQGIQHYENITFSKGNTHSHLEGNIKRDKIKEEYAKKKNIPLLLISYKEFDKIENLIEKFIEENFSK